jgi:CheY-like chemotaxis protein
MTRRILIIDDEEDIRQVAGLSLETVAGWEVVLANSGMQGMEQAEKEHPDAILLDVTFLQLQKNPKTAKIPVILLTAKVQGSDQRRFAELGVAGILFKPFDPLTLSTQVSQTLGWPQVH